MIGLFGEKAIEILYESNKQLLVFSKFFNTSVRHAGIACDSYCIVTAADKSAHAEGLPLVQMSNGMMLLQSEPFWQANIKHSHYD